MKRTAEVRKIIASVEDTHREVANTGHAEPQMCRRRGDQQSAGRCRRRGSGCSEGYRRQYFSPARGTRLEALGAGPDDVQSYGKGAIVGVDGEIEHAAALIHPGSGRLFAARSATPARSSHRPRKWGAGASLAVPLTSKHSIWEFDHMDAAEMTFPDAPHAGEIVVILALGIGGRPLKRIRPD